MAAKKFMRLHLPSLPACAEFVTQRERKWRINDSAASSFGNSWDLGADLPKALEYAKSGWHEGARNIANGLQTLPARGTQAVRQYGIAGSRPVPSRYVAGNPRCMVRKGTQERPKPALTIAVQIGANGSTDAQCMSNYGLALASYVERLILMGYPVELIASDTYLYEKMRFIISWTVKPMGAPLNFADMAFSIGHPAAMRRLSFALAERSDCPDYGNYGAAGDCLPSDFEGRRNVIILNGMLKANQHSQTPESAMAHVSEAIKAAMTAQGL